MIKIVHNKMLDGWYVVRGRHHTPISGRFTCREAALDWLHRSRCRYVVVEHPGCENETDVFTADTYTQAIRFIDRNYNDYDRLALSPDVVKIMPDGSRTTEY